MNEPTIMKWTKEQQEAITACLDFNSKENVLILGKAGTGKSFLTRHIMSELKLMGKIGFSCAPTGIAALNLGDGETIHKAISTLRRGYKIPVDYFLIDEVSMCRCDLADELETVLYHTTKVNELWGGVKIIAIGDFGQLPPVMESDSAEEEYIKDNYFSEYFFSSSAYAHSKWNVIELTKVFRQKDNNYTLLLNKIREGKNQKTVQYLNTNHLTNKPKGVFLTPTNKAAEEVNKFMLSEIKGPLVSLQAQAFGKIQKHEYPAPDPFEFKIGAKVMVIKNIYQMCEDLGTSKLELINGDVGVVVGYDDVSGAVKFLSDRTKNEHEIYAETWDKKESVYDFKTKELVKNVVASFTQYPLRLAWAITIHKSQGATIEELTIDMRSGMFAAGQLYVALSRGVSLEKLHIIGRVKPTDVIICPVVNAFLKDFKSGVGVKPGSKFEGFLKKREEKQKALTLNTNGVDAVSEYVPPENPKTYIVKGKDISEYSQDFREKVNKWEVEISPEFKKDFAAGKVKIVQQGEVDVIEEDFLFEVNKEKLN